MQVKDGEEKGQYNQNVQKGKANRNWKQTVCVDWEGVFRSLFRCFCRFCQYCEEMRKIQKQTERGRKHENATTW